MKRTLITGLTLALCLAGYALWSVQSAPVGSTADAAQGAPLADVILPESLSAQAQMGKRAYDAVCAVCHGTDAAGHQGVAPPLVHIIYEPSHHGDEAFQRAVAYGVRAHHWRFGDMPAVEGVTRADVANIIAYIRELQRANGID